MNHKNSNKNKTDKLNEFDVRYTYEWIYGYRGNPTERKKYDEKVADIPLNAFMKKRRLFSTTRVTNGICDDCGKTRCMVCNGCPINLEDLDSHHCQRCICYNEKEQLIQEPLNDTGVSLDELIRHRKGCRKKEQKQ